MQVYISFKNEEKLPDKHSILKRTIVRYVR